MRGLVSGQSNDPVKSDRAGQSNSHFDTSGHSRGSVNSDRGAQKRDSFDNSKSKSKNAIKSMPSQESQSNTTALSKTSQSNQMGKLRVLLAEDSISVQTMVRVIH